MSYTHGRCSNCMVVNKICSLAPHIMPLRTMTAKGEWRLRLQHQVVTDATTGGSASSPQSSADGDSVDGYRLGNGLTRATSTASPLLPTPACICTTVDRLSDEGFQNTRLIKM